MEENNNEELKEALEQLKRKESEDKIESNSNKKVVIIWTIIGICFVFLSILAGIWLFTAAQKLLGIGLIVLSILTIIGMRKENKIIKNISRVVAVMGIIGIVYYIILLIRVMYMAKGFFDLVLPNLKFIG